MRITTAILALCVACASAYSINNGNGAEVSRRAAFSKTAAAAFGVASIAAASATPASALEACPAKSQNCIRTQWVPPAGSSQADATASLRKAIEAYPQEGQNKADLGGWTIVEDNFANGSARIEYKSGIGNFAKFFNGGKPFIDDLKLEIASSGVVEVRSSSRIGESDLGVNKKRLQYLITALTADGWTCPEPTY
uniref:DUF1499 domain-containing protein n=1 Tax=Craspedostauros australis TaxID=1486917 RepID=A0A7R9ZN89_9STRA|mmetsp:Transcript_2688/g.7474  ORF Transcript_2688/g.7474 Transcript_2688/m.7474 type:complete len:195 (+) Transcript_2688:109-693(+)|eukprot:CAMPEP_0198134314 /NCGR_PEP_ID=MMETSP1442-20131203/60008_1 /TAXON_ID= /ORGANISM="Craspedostauros australis, Strain CCMP3328" /LENGTH=194 /DNA_ID=CAMNT_0043795457 /DNA_START=60 /DNA_END=644 /DNA_ORIENTATION=-